jgi:DNA adenine methylase
MPFGNSGFANTNKEYILNGCEFFSKNTVNLYQKSFIDFKIDNKNDFVYLDPPYMNTTATYNEGRGIEGWNMNLENQLFKFCEDLTLKGIKFGMSNVFTNKKISNTHLIEWVEKNKYNVIHLNKKYSVCSKKSYNTDEVFISNYKPIDSIFDL